MGSHARMPDVYHNWLIGLLGVGSTVLLAGVAAIIGALVGVVPPMNPNGLVIFAGITLMAIGMCLLLTMIPVWRAGMKAARVAVNPAPVVAVPSKASDRRRKLTEQVLAEPGKDGLYRYNGDPVCPECLRKKGLISNLGRERVGGSRLLYPDGSILDTPSRPTNKWACSVCEKVYTASRRRS